MKDPATQEDLEVLRARILVEIADEVEELSNRYGLARKFLRELAERLRRLVRRS